MDNAVDRGLRPVFEDIESHARDRAGAMAVVRARAGLRYGELNALANRAANRLLGVGVGFETRIGVRFERSPDLLIALVAVAKCGASAVLLDPGWPAEALERFLEITRPRLTLSPGVQWANLTADGDDAPRNPGKAVPLDTVAYWVSTSGSTGLQKAVGVTHRALAHRARTHIAGYAIRPDDRSSWLSPPGASIFAVELWPYLVAGATVCIPPAGVPASPDELRDWLTAQRIDKAFVPMPTGEMLFGLDWADPVSLRLMTVGGDTVRRWPPASLPFEVAVEYGSAEANGVSSTLVTPDDQPTPRRLADGAAEQRPPIGRPWPDVDVRVLDELMRPVPTGKIGELYVGGPELARGYLDAPSHTAQRFLPHPWRAGERLYRTGDLVARTADGMLHHRGRVDSQVKILGHRVEPAEVEAVLLDHPAVAETAVAGRPDPRGTLRLVAYVVPDSALDTAELLRLAARRLPGHLVPALVVVLPELPRNPGGKVDRGRLPEPAWSVGTPAHWPGGDIERTVAAIWTEEVGRPPAGPDEHFLDAGGDSFRAGRMLARIRDEVGVPIRLREFFREPTLEALCRRVRSGATTSGVPNTVRG